MIFPRKKTAKNVYFYGTKKAASEERVSLRALSFCGFNNGKKAYLNLIASFFLDAFLFCFVEKNFFVNKKYLFSFFQP